MDDFEFGSAGELVSSLNPAEYGTRGTGELIKKTNAAGWSAIVNIGGIEKELPFLSQNESHAQKFLDRYLMGAVELEDDIWLGHTWERYVESPRRRHQEKATLESKRNVWINYLIWLFINFPQYNTIKDIEIKSVSKWLAYMEEGLTGGTWNARMCIVREVYHTLCKEIGYQTEIWEGVQQKFEDRHTRREFSTEEILRIGDSATRQGDVWRKLFTIGLYTGLRLGDCCMLDWTNVNLVEGIIQIVPHKTRKHTKGKVVTIPIHAILLSIFMETPPELRQGPVTPALAHWYQNQKWVLMQNIKLILEDAGIQTSVKIAGRKHAAPDATFHSLRHTFVSMAVNAGVPIPVVQSIVGHESVTMTRHYYHENIKALKKAVASIPPVKSLMSSKHIDLTRPGEVQLISENIVLPPDIKQIDYAQPS